jgi:hypothetical protein
MLDTTHCQEYFATVLAHSKQLGTAAEAQLQKMLGYLNLYACKTGTAEDGSPILDPETTKCILHKDFAAYSFVFTMERRVSTETCGPVYNYWFDGGLIFHSPNVPDPLSVVLTTGDEPEEYWMIHT